MTVENVENIKEIRLYVGTYTKGASEGIYLYRMDPSSGVLEPGGTPTKAEDPSFLAIHPGGRYLYSVNEIWEFDGKPSGALCAFSIDPASGDMTFLNRQPSHGTSPCHLSVDKSGKFVLVANYGSGVVSMLPIDDDGRLGEATDILQHHGSSVDPERQEGPHAHSITIDLSNRYAFAADLGLDKVMIYKIDLTQGKLKPNDPPWAQVKGGAGPRHFAFHPSGKYAYVINEIDATLTAFNYDESNGTLDEIETVSTIPDDYHGEKSCADIHVSPSGKFLYGSNRGHDSIVIFAIDEGTGKLTHIGHQPTQGKTPRNFAIDPTGTFLLAANQDSDSVVTFRIDAQTGTLMPTGQVTEVPAPVCLKMVPVFR